MAIINDGSKQLGPTLVNLFKVKNTIYHNYNTHIGLPGRLRSFILIILRLPIFSQPKLAPSAIFAFLGGRTTLGINFDFDFVLSRATA